jgi:hypothetical protein
MGLNSAFNGLTAQMSVIKASTKTKKQYKYTKQNPEQTKRKQ